MFWFLFGWFCWDFGVVIVVVVWGVGGWVICWLGRVVFVCCLCFLVGD